MCSLFIVPTADGHAFCETVGQLKALLGEVVPYAGTELDGDEFCLCNVDQNATAELHGFAIGRDPDGIDILFVKGESGIRPPNTDRN